jgi:hypothetical protein
MGISVDVYSFWGVQLDDNRFAGVYEHEPELLEGAAREAGLKIVNTGDLDLIDSVTVAPHSRG